jgi:hypothetical protein
VRRLGAAAVVAALALAGCGGGDDDSGTTPRATSTPSTPTTDTGPKAKTPETPTTSTSTSPEQQPGGAGDETPAHFDASLTGRGGRITPREVQVGPFISVRVRLRSADGQIYRLRINGKTLQAQGGDTAELSLPGLRAGRSYTLEQPSGGPAVKITANAEPGP